MDLSGKRVLVVRLSALGDVIRTLPAVVGLQKEFPTAEFHWLVEKPSSALLRAVPGLHLLEVSRNDLRRGNPIKRLNAFRAVVREIRKRRIEVAVDFHGVLKSGIFPFLAGVPVRIGYEKGGSKEGARWLVNRRLRLKSKRISRYERNQALAKFIHENASPRVPTFAIDAAAKNQVDQLMMQRPIVFFPGTSAHGKNKRWPATHWAWLFKNVATRYPVRFLFGPADKPYQEALEELLGDTMKMLPALSLTQLAYALRRSSCLVSCDTGPLHLAAVQKVPVVAMLGPSDPVLNQPQTPFREVLLPGVACAPCRNRSCEILICQDMTTPQRVAAAVHRIMQRTGEQEL